MFILLFVSNFVVVGAFVAHLLHIVISVRTPCEMVFKINIHKINILTKFCSIRLLPSSPIQLSTFRRTNMATSIQNLTRTHTLIFKHDIHKELKSTRLVSTSSIQLPTYRQMDMATLIQNLTKN